MKEKKTKGKTEVVYEGNLFDENLEIFGEHKTREQAKAEEKARKKQEREALTKELKRRRLEGKTDSTARRKDIVAVVAVLGGIVLLCAAALIVSFFRAEDKNQWEINPDRGHYQNPNAVAEMSGEEPKPAVKEAYFTQNGHLCVELLFSNGTDKMLSIDAIEVKVYNSDTGELVAGGMSEIDDLIIEVAGTSAYTFLISPEHVFVEDTVSVPQNIEFEINTIHNPVTVD